MNAVSIDGRRIGQQAPPYLIAELSANHGGDLARAKRIVRLASECGADAIKFQVYTADSLTIDSPAKDFTIGSNSLWQGRSLYELYKSAAMPYAWLEELFSYARELRITPFCSVFDLAGIQILERLNTPAYKIASFEAVDLELIAACLESGKPVIVSTGLCSLDEVEEIVNLAGPKRRSQLLLLKCNSAYPAKPAEANLLSIPDMVQRFDVPVGYSDHTLGVTSAVAACALGACVVEKHFIDEREPATADSAFSMLPDEFRTLVSECRAAALARGKVFYGTTGDENASLIFRRSLYAVADVAAGDVFTSTNIRSIRPGYGLPPKHLREILGKKAARSLRRGEALRWEMIQ